MHPDICLITYKRYLYYIGFYSTFILVSQIDVIQHRLINLSPKDFLPSNSDKKGVPMPSPNQVLILILVLSTPPLRLLLLPPHSAHLNFAPSPIQLKRKILLKHKRLKPDVEKAEMEMFLKGALEVDEELLLLTSHLVHLLLPVLSFPCLLPR